MSLTTMTLSEELKLATKKTRQVAADLRAAVERSRRGY